MKIQLDVARIPGLPPLAWLAEIDRSTGSVSAKCGSLVETTSDMAVEGAWAGDYGGRAERAATVFGTGVHLRPSCVWLVPSTATTDYIYYAADGTRLVAANSLPLLLAHQGDALRPDCHRYDEINNSILRGFRAYERELPTRNGSVCRLMHSNLRITRDAVSELPKAQPPNFRSYEEYRSFLQDEYARLVQNARDPHRAAPLRIYTTQSRGYDSTAVNAIAAPHGVDAVFTVTTGKAGGSFSDTAGEREQDDDGTAIAHALGIGPVIPIARRAFVSDFADELYFRAGIHECQDANIRQVSARIRAPALLLTGTLGEIWYTRSPWYEERPETLGDDLPRADLSLHGLTEVRLRAGYIQAALPYVGATRRAQLLAITESSDMHPWRLGTRYDRPIPRRLGEEAGVPRELFGQIKVGSVVEFSRPEIPFDRTLRQEYLRWLVSEGVRTPLSVRLIHSVRRLNDAVWFASDSRHRALFFALRVIGRLTRRAGYRPVLWRELRGSLFCFAVNKCAAEYASSLRELARGGDRPGRAATG